MKITALPTTSHQRAPTSPTPMGNKLQQCSEIILTTWVSTCTISLRPFPCPVERNDHNTKRLSLQEHGSLTPPREGCITYIPAPGESPQGPGLVVSEWGWSGSASAAAAGRVRAAPGPAAARRARARRLREAGRLREALGRAGHWVRAQAASAGCSGHSALARGLWDKSNMSSSGGSSPCGHTGPPH